MEWIIGTWYSIPGAKFDSRRVRVLLKWNSLGRPV